MSTATLSRSPGLLLDPAADPWGDAGLLGFPAGDEGTTPPVPQSLRDFIATAYPRYGFHRWADLLIERLQAVADGELSRLIVTCPPRLGKSLLVSKLFPAYFIQRHPQLFCAIACPASTPLAAWRQSSWPVRAAHRPQVVADDNLPATVAEATRKLSHPPSRAMVSTGLL